MLNQDQLMIRDAVRSFAQEQLWPHAAKWDKEHHFPTDVHKGLAELGAYLLGSFEKNLPVRQATVLLADGSLLEGELERGAMSAAHLTKKRGSEEALRSLEAAHRGDSRLFLEHLRRTKPHLLATGEGILGNVLVHPSAKVHPDSLLGPDVCVGENCVVAAGARLQTVCLFADSSVGRSSYLRQTIVSWRSQVGAWTRIEGLTVIAEDCSVADELLLVEAMVFPQKAVTESSREPGLLLL